MDDEVGELGPIDFAIFEFPGSRFNGAVAPNILELVERGLITILDLVFIQKADDGTVVGVELTDMDADEAGGLTVFAGHLNDVLAEEDIEAAGDVLEPGSSALVAVWENTWAAPLATAIYESGGVLASSGRIPAQDLLSALEA